MAIKFKGLSIIQSDGGRIELWDGDGVEICNSVQSLIKVLSYYDDYSELPSTTDIRESMEEEEDNA
tara:strand:- start:393 stop:590 length:198 start_codon:yes stop_codon:yes gene_type:complete